MMVKLTSILDYDRGAIWDFVMDQTGLCDYDLLNSHYVIHQNILKTIGDKNYLISKARSRRCVKKIKHYSNVFLKEAENIIKNIGINKSSFTFDTYFSLLNAYAWHKHPVINGTGYSDIFNKINNLKKIYTNKKNELDSIHRRLAYIETMGDEIYYMLERYDFEIKPYYIEWITNKFETFTSFAAQTALQIVELFYDIRPEIKKLKRSQRTFKNILNLLKDIISFFDTLNDAYYSLILVELRNSMVHGSGINLEMIKDDIFINFEINLGSKKKLKFYNLKDRIRNEIIPNFSSIIKPFKWYTIPDPNFNFITWKLKGLPNNKFDVDNPIIKVHLDMRTYVDKMMKFFLYQISMRLFKQLLDYQYKYWGGSASFGKWIKKMDKNITKLKRTHKNKPIDYQFFECCFI